MILEIFAVFDAKVGAYMRPFFAESTGAALRAFGDGVNDPTTAFFKHPEDYTLFRLGNFVPLTGALTVENAPVALSQALFLKEKVPA